jgi:glycosyltransferase involved in cell wall biosynthesis
MMSDESLISVVVPAFNAARFLPDAIRSIESQRYPQLEILVVDDGSTDGTADAAQSFSRVRLIRQTNGGIAAARNTGVLAARGRWLAFLDADDLWTEQKLSLQINGLQRRSDVDLIAGRVEQFHDPSWDRPTVPLPDAGDAYTAGAMLIRRDDFLRVGLFNPALRVGEFVDWHSRAMNFGLRECLLDSVVLRRRIHGENTTLRRQDSTGDYLAVLKAHLDRKRTAACH